MRATKGSCIWRQTTDTLLRPFRSCNHTCEISPSNINMQGRIKPRFEDLANAALKKPTLVPPPTVLLPPPDHTAAVSEFRSMSGKLAGNQYDAAGLLARAQQIAQQTGTPVEIALDAMAREQSAAATGTDMAAVSAQAAAGQDRLAQQNADRFFGQTLLEYRNNARIQNVARQVQAAHTNPFDVAASGSVAAATPTERAAIANEAAAAAAVPGGDDTDMSLLTPPVFGSGGRAQAAPKSYEQIRQELKAGLVQAVRGSNASLLWGAIEDFQGWINENQATNVDDAQIQLLTLVVGLADAKSSTEATVVVGQILGLLDMSTESSVISKIAGYWDSQLVVQPTGQGKGLRGPPDGSDRTLKVKTTLEQFRAARTAAAAKRDKDKETRQANMEKRRFDQGGIVARPA